MEEGGMLERGVGIGVYHGTKAQAGKGVKI